MAAPWLPWQPIQKFGFIILCVLFLCIHPPNMVSIGCFVFELHLLPCLANQRPCLVTMATRSKQPLFFTTRHHGLQYGIQHSSADIWESCVKRSPNIGRFCLKLPLKWTQKSVYKKTYGVFDKSNLILWAAERCRMLGFKVGLGQVL